MEGVSQKPPLLSFSLLAVTKTKCRSRLVATAQTLPSSSRSTRRGWGRTSAAIPALWSVWANPDLCTTVPHGQEPSGVMGLPTAQTKHHKHTPCPAQTISLRTATAAGKGQTLGEIRQSLVTTQTQQNTTINHNILQSNFKCTVH